MGDRTRTPLLTTHVHGERSVMSTWTHAKGLEDDSALTFAGTGAFVLLNQAHALSVARRPCNGACSLAFTVGERGVACCLEQEFNELQIAVLRCQHERRVAAEVATAVTESASAGYQ